LGYDALQIGLAFLPVTVIMGTLSVKYSEPLISRFGARTTLVPGLVLIAIALVWFAQAGTDADYITPIFPVLVLMGTGAGLAFPALMGLAMSGATPEDAGLASGLINTTAQVGGALGLAVLATLSASRTETLLGGGDSHAAALAGGYHLAFWIAAGVVAASIVAALVLLEQPAKVANGAGEPALSHA